MELKELFIEDIEPVIDEHSRNTTALTIAIYKSLNSFTPKTKDEIILKEEYKLIDPIELIIGSLIHDVGKMKSIENHTIEGYKMLKRSVAYTSIGRIVLAHHERWDGNGKPLGLKARLNSLESRIVVISNVLERKDLEEMKELLLKEQGKMFDPLLSRLILKNLESIYNHYQLIKPKDFINQPISSYIY